MPRSLDRVPPESIGKRLQMPWGLAERPCAFNVTDGHEHDPSQLLCLLAQVDREIDRFLGGRIYDLEAVYEAVDHHSPATKPHGTKVSRHFGTKPTV